MDCINCIKRKVITPVVTTFVIALLMSCAIKDDSDKHSYANDISGLLYNQKNNLKLNKNNNEVISMDILGNKVIRINKDRINDDIYGTGFLDNRWNLDEIDTILDALKGAWQIDQYIGFVSPSIYYPNLFDPSDNLAQDIKDQLYKGYEEKIASSKNNMPAIHFSIKESDNINTNNNYIYVYGHSPSPISIILSIDRASECYPVFVDQTTLSRDFIAEYPVLYIKFFIDYSENGQTKEYEPATLVITSDNRFYILIDGAFYSLKEL